MTARDASGRFTAGHTEMNRRLHRGRGSVDVSASTDNADMNARLRRAAGRSVAGDTGDQGQETAEVPVSHGSADGGARGSGTGAPPRDMNAILRAAARGDREALQRLERN